MFKTMFGKVVNSLCKVVVFVAICNAETSFTVCFYGSFFVGHAGNKGDKVWQQISRRGVVGTGQNFAGS